MSCQLLHFYSMQNKMFTKFLTKKEISQKYNERPAPCEWSLRESTERRCENKLTKSMFGFFNKISKGLNKFWMNLTSHHENIHSL